MSSRKTLRRATAVSAMAAVISSLGCWEQMSDEWFPQMKRQRAVQAFEDRTVHRAGQGFSPPEGAVAVGNPYPNVGGMELMAQEALLNPVPASLESLKSGRALFNRHCTTCHGPEGHGDGSVAGPPFGTGPLGVVIPIGGHFSLANAFSDGHIYTSIALGRGRMPSFKHIPVNGRWDLINYVRTLNDQRDRR